MLPISIPIRIVVAMGKHQEIGAKNKLLWNLPKDLAHFREVTMGKPIIMGRSTFESIGKPLPKRTNIVLTRSSQWKMPGVITASSLGEALRCAQKENPKEICIIGGAQIYDLCLEVCTHLSVTFVDAEFPEADAFFPKIDGNQWREVSRKQYPKDAENEYSCDVVELKRNEK